MQNGKYLITFSGKKNFQLLFDKGQKVYRKTCMGVYILKSIQLDENPKSKIPNFFDAFSKDELSDFIKNNKSLFAVVTPKKFCKSAVIRNRLKRLIRVALRELFESNEKYSQSIYVLLINWKNFPKKSNQINLNFVKSELEFLLKNIVNN